MFILEAPMTVKELIFLLQQVKNKDSEVLAKTIYTDTSDFITTELQNVAMSDDGEEVWIDVELPFDMPASVRQEKPRVKLHVVK
jgi:hypothetical protein